MFNFIIGLILLIGGVAMVMYTEWLLQNFGRIAWFEQKLGTEGGSRLGYKLVGMLFIFFGILCITGLVGGFLEFIASPLTRLNKQG
jgi:hypothetical protein